MYESRKEIDDRHIAIDFTGIVEGRIGNATSDESGDNSDDSTNNDNISVGHSNSSSMVSNEKISLLHDPKTPVSNATGIPAKWTTLATDANSTMPSDPPSPSPTAIKKHGPSVNHSIEEKPLLDEIREVMAHSQMLFLLTDLRHMSATGRIGTKYENLAIDSDLCKRDSAKRIACLSDNVDDDEIRQIGYLRGLSPAVIMAITILEIRDTAVKNAEEKTRSRKKGDEKYRYATSVDIDDDDQFVAYENNEEKRKMTEESMTSLMRCYARIISEDLVEEIPNVRRRRANYQNPFGGSISNPTGVRGVSSSTPNELSAPSSSTFQTPLSKKKSSRGNSAMSRSTITSLVPVLEERVSSVGFEVEPVASADMEDNGDGKSIDSGGADVDQNLENLKDSNRTQVSFKIDHDSVGSEASTTRSKFFSPGKWNNRHESQEGQRPRPSHMPSFRETIKSTAENSKQIADRIKTDLNQRADNLLSSTNTVANTQKEFQELTEVLFDQGEVVEEIKSTLGDEYSRKEMVDIMRNAVEERNDNLLQFMSKLFVDGSLSKLMVESQARVVWVNDWYPMKDLTYAITVDPGKRRVMVVFRGAITVEDWKSAMKFKFFKIRNPVKDEYDGKKDVLRVFSGLYTYLFRKRKDTGTTKYDEIANMVHKYGTESIGPDYKLLVTGHSLGGALTHFFTFYASTEERFTKYGPVKGIAFASPYIGGHSWADAIRHQERTKKLQLVQCRNCNDLIPRLPPNLWIGRRGPLWRHVGISVTMPKILSCGIKSKPLVHYWGKEKSCLQSTIHAYRRNFLFYFPYLRPWQMDRNHTLFELQERLMYGERNSKGDGLELLKCTLDELYEKLEENKFETLAKTKNWGIHRKKRDGETKPAK